MIMQLFLNDFFDNNFIQYKTSLFPRCLLSLKIQVLICNTDFDHYTYEIRNNKNKI